MSQAQKPLSIATTWLKNHKPLAIVLAVGILLTLGWLIVRPYLERWASNEMAKRLPEVASVYTAEQKRFPGYHIGATKNLVYGPKPDGTNGPVTSYNVSLTSYTKMPSETEARQAGHLACQSGLPPAATLYVTMRWQFYGLPFYAGKTIAGHCPPVSAGKV